MRILISSSIALFVLIQTLAVSGQADPNFVLSVGTVPGTAGASVEVPVILEHADAADAFSFGISHDGLDATAVTGVTGVTGAAVASSNGGAGPDFFAVNIAPIGGDGFTVGCVISLAPPFDAVASALDSELTILTYDVDPGATDTIPLVLTGSLGNPAVVLEITALGLPVEPTTEDGAITLGGGGAEFLRGEINGDGIPTLGDAVLLLGILFLGAPTPWTLTTTGFSP